MTTAALSHLLRKRRSVFPKMYKDKPIPKEILMEILEHANWAPTHRLTEPWRFKVMTGEALQRLSDYAAEFYAAHTPADKFSDLKYNKTKQKPLQSAAVIAICMERDPEKRVPEWEEIAAVAMAVQNMWLTCTAHHIGCYWSSPKAALEADEFLNLKEGERCLGWLYMGYHDMPELPGRRTPIGEKVEWL